MCVYFLMHLLEGGKALVAKSLFHRGVYSSLGGMPEIRCMLVCLLRLGLLLFFPPSPPSLPFSSCLLPSFLFLPPFRSSSFAKSNQASQAPAKSNVVSLLCLQLNEGRRRRKRHATNTNKQASNQPPKGRIDARTIFLNFIFPYQK